MGLDGVEAAAAEWRDEAVGRPQQQHHTHSLRTALPPYIDVHAERLTRSSNSQQQLEGEPHPSRSTQLPRLHCRPPAIGSHLKGHRLLWHVFSAMASPISASIFPFDHSTSSSSLSYAILAAILVIALQPLLSISAPLLSRYPRLHLQRRLQHVVTNLLLTWLSTSPSLFSRSSLLVVLSGCAVVLLCLQFLRRHAAFNSAFVRSCGSLLRPHELHGLPAGYYNLLSVLLCVVLNEAVPAVVTMHVVRLSLLYEAVGDPMAAIVGTALSPSRASEGKTVAGSVAMTLTCSAVTAVYLIASHCPLFASWLIVPPVVCAIAERYTGRENRWLRLDDNLTVPLLTCIVVSSLQAIHLLPSL